MFKQPPRVSADRRRAVPPFYAADRAGHGYRLLSRVALPLPAHKRDEKKNVEIMNR